MTPQIITARSYCLTDSLAAAPIPAKWVTAAPTADTSCEGAANEPSPPPVVGRIVATRPDGSTYAGELIADVLEYRTLRWRSLRAEIMNPEEIHRYAALDGKLRQSNEEDAEVARLRMFQRFECSFPARVLYTNSHGAPSATDVLVEDMSAGGVKVAWEHDLSAGEPIELVLALGGEDRVVRFPARVAWTRTGALGLMFAGAAA